MGWEKTGTLRAPVITLRAFPAAPVAPVPYETYFDTALGQQLIWNGANWQLPDGTAVDPSLPPANATYPSATTYPTLTLYPGAS
jgi:hypothetical protein